MAKYTFTTILLILLLLHLNVCKSDNSVEDGNLESKTQGMDPAIIFLIERGVLFICACLFICCIPWCFLVQKNLRAENNIAGSMSSVVVLI